MQNTAICSFTVTANTEGIDVTNTVFQVSVFLKVGVGIISKGGFPIWCVFSMSCCDITDNSHRLNSDLSISCDSWFVTKANSFLFSRITSVELSNLASWEYMAITPLFGIEPEKLCNVGLLLPCEGWVQYWCAKILEIQYWELNELDWFLEELDWFPDTLIISFSLLPLAWTAFFLGPKLVSSVWLSSHSKLILFAIWEIGTFLCLFSPSIY